MKEYLYEIITGKTSGPFAAVIKLLLFMLSLVYGLGLFFRKLLYKLHILKSKRLTAKVISIGNITWGGTGKTPLVEFIASSLKERGHKVAVLSRGYKRKKTGANQIIHNGKDLNSKVASLNDLGDEAFLLAEALADVPIGVGPDRVKSARIIQEKFHPDILILDDGFQHRRIARDLDIVAIDATHPFGNGFILPLGIMREPKCALKRADIFVITKTNINPDIKDLKAALDKINPRALIVECEYKILGLYDALDAGKKLKDLSGFKDRPIACISSIANPASFEKMLSLSGMEIKKVVSFTDHHHYTRGDIEGIVASCRANNIENVVTTEKDKVRLKDYLLNTGGIRFFVLKIALEIKQHEEFFKRISSIY